MGRLPQPNRAKIFQVGDTVYSQPTQEHAGVIIALVQYNRGTNYVVSWGPEYGAIECCAEEITDEKDYKTT